MTQECPKQVKTVCYHCGEDLLDLVVGFDDKEFCCVGCKSVYQILSENKMCNYYAYNANPGQKLQHNQHFEYLDEASIITQLIDYRDDRNTIITFYIPAIHCSSCIWLLEHLYKINPAIFDSRLDFIKKQVTMSFKHDEISLRQVVECLSEIGYEPSISLQDVNNENWEEDNKSLILKIAIAGFCMGNVMLFSFPEYFGLSAFESQFQHLFGWLNLAFSIPVAFYCGKDYFISAIASLRHKHINLDTPLALIIGVLFLRTAYTVIFNEGPGFADTLTGLVFLLLLGKWIKQRTYHHISFDRDYRSYFPIAITTLKDGVEKPMAIGDLSIGDRLWIRNGELIPADAILMKGDAWLDMSFVTGEAEPQQKILGEMLYAGGRQLGEAIEVEIIKLVSQSYLTSLWNKENYKTDFKKNNFNDDVAMYFSIGVFIIAVASTAYWIFNSDSNKAWSAFTSVIIVACPCVLALSTPFTLSAILSVFDRKGFYVKNTDALEQLAKCDSIVFDKTGTLTSSANAKISFNGDLTTDQKVMVASLVRHSSHPLSQHILNQIGRNSFYPIEAYVESVGKGLKGMVKDQMIYAGSPRILPYKNESFDDNGVHIVIGETYKGCFSIQQEWRNGLQELITGLSKKFTLSVLSGDTNKDEQALKSFFPHHTTIAFKQSPLQKLNFIIDQQTLGKQVIMLGDGLNDAGALKQSNFGIAITENINNFTPGCDAILTSNSLLYLPQFIKLSKQGLTIIKISFAIAITYNTIGLFYAVQGTLYPLVAAVLMPISTITIISFTSIATRLFARKNSLV